MEYDSIRYVSVTVRSRSPFRFFTGADQAVRPPGAARRTTGNCESGCHNPDSTICVVVEVSVLAVFLVVFLIVTIVLDMRRDFACPLNSGLQCVKVRSWRVVLQFARNLGLLGLCTAAPHMARPPRPGFCPEGQLTVTLLGLEPTRAATPCAQTYAPYLPRFGMRLPPSWMDARLSTTV